MGMLFLLFFFGDSFFGLAFRETILVFGGMEPFFACFFKDTYLKGWLADIKPSTFRE